jgi:hypothetical protein
MSFIARRNIAVVLIDVSAPQEWHFDGREILEPVAVISRMTVRVRRYLGVQGPLYVPWYSEWENTGTFAWDYPGAPK